MKREEKVILMLSANPKNSDSLRLAEEIREIKEGLRRSKNRARFKIVTYEAVRYRDIQRALLDIEPNILHFSGHGAAEKGLVFEDETGNSFLVNADALTNLFKLFSDKLDYVLLNACFSQVQARAIVKHIPYVIGMKEAIGDRAAIEFAVGFYDALGAGRDVNFAYKLACSAIAVAGIPEHLTPQLLTKESFENLASQQNSPSSKLESGLESTNSSQSQNQQHSAEKDYTQSHDISIDERSGGVYFGRGSVIVNGDVVGNSQIKNS